MAACCTTLAVRYDSMLLRWGAKLVSVTLASGIERPSWVPLPRLSRCSSEGIASREDASTHSADQAVQQAKQQTQSELGRVWLQGSSRMRPAESSNSPRRYR